MIEEHSRLKHATSTSTISISTNSISTSKSEQLSATEDSDMIFTDEDTTICDNTPSIVSIIEGGGIGNEVGSNNEVEDIVRGSSNGPLIDETNMVLTKKRIRLELSENTGIDIKRFKLNIPTNNTNTQMKRPVAPPAKRKPSLRLGVRIIIRLLVLV